MTPETSDRSRPHAAVIIAGAARQTLAADLTMADLTVADLTRPIESRVTTVVSHAAERTTSDVPDAEPSDRES